MGLNAINAVLASLLTTYCAAAWCQTDKPGGKQKDSETRTAATEKKTAGEKVPGALDPRDQKKAADSAEGSKATQGTRMMDICVLNPKLSQCR